ncbi:MAG: hypothetical protein O7E52_04230 [Candidatus Poribacteria bacterium]|nr:hypothetical protein [Candidatus Poribacteria bacterium]
MRKYLQWIIISALLANLSCSAFQTVRIVPVFDPEATILPASGAVVHVKNGITAMAVPLNEVKEVDAFGVIIFNSTDHFISFKQKDCWMLDQSGNQTKTIHKSLLASYLGKNFKPRLPPEFPAEVFRWNRAFRAMGDIAPLPREDIERTTVMPKRRTQFFLYFPKRSIKSSNLRIIVPKVYSEYADTETTFVFKFEVQRG